MSILDQCLVAIVTIGVMLLAQLLDLYSLREHYRLSVTESAVAGHDRSGINLRNSEGERNLKGQRPAFIPLAIGSE